MRKLYAAILSAAICLAVSGAPAWASEHQSTLSAGYLQRFTLMMKLLSVVRTR